MHCYKLFKVFYKLAPSYVCQRGSHQLANPNCLSEWENLDPEIRLFSSVNIFKRKLMSILWPPQKSVYRIHEPKGLFILTQLGLVTSLSFGHKNERRKGKKRKKRKKESRKDRVVTLVHPIEATFKFFYSPDIILYGE